MVPDFCFRSLQSIECRTLCRTIWRTNCYMNTNQNDVVVLSAICVKKVVCLQPLLWVYLYNLKICLESRSYTIQINCKVKIWILRPFQEYFTSSRSLIRGGRKPKCPEKNHLTYRCRTWHLTCTRAVVRDPMLNSQRRS